MSHEFEAFQFLSRRTVTGDLGVITTSPKQRPDVEFRFDLRVEPKPFELAFAQLKAVPPSIGAHQYVDLDIDRFLARRWPMCISIHGEVRLPELQLGLEFRKQLLRYPQTILWTHRSLRHALPRDQRAHQPGYRREYFTQQIFDVMGNRRSSSKGTYVSTEIDEPTGPGVVTFREWSGFNDEVNELVWSPTLPFHNRTTFEQDKARIKAALDALQKHYNSNSEFEAAERYLEAGDLKAAVRFAASAVDAILHYYINVWDLTEPPRYLPFDEKIDNMLQAAGRPTYRSVNLEGSVHLRHLYRCRNSMHEGDCYYNDDTGFRVNVRSASIVAPWVKTVEQFIIWIDSLA